MKRHLNNRIIQLLVVVAFFSKAAAQSVALPSPLFPKKEIQEVSTEKADFSSISTTSGKGLPQGHFSETIDNSIDEKSYMVGGGDAFIISNADKTNLLFIGTVNQNGNLHIPDLGEFSIGKVSLQKAKEMIRGFVRRKLRSSDDITVALHKAKIANTNVAGMLVIPGTYEIAGTMRIWDAIRAACRNFDGHTVQKLFEECDMRSVKRINGDTVDLLDMFAYVYNGDFSHNPYVYPGDKIIISPVKDRVFIHGEITGPRLGWIQIRYNEHAGNLLTLFTFNDNTDSGNIQLRRKETVDNGNTEMHVINISENPQEVLRNGDIITVPSKENVLEVFMVTIEGEIRRTGMYPIEKGKTTPDDIFTMAGGKTQFANNEKTAIIRREKFSVAMPMILEGKAAEFGEPIKSVRPELGSAMGLMTTTKDYSVINLKDHPDLILEPNDHIFVPRSEKTVYVSGNVKYPGGYPYVKGKTKEYYIQKAGGFTEKASRSNMYLVAEYGEARQVFDREIIEDGDVIVVPMSQEFKKLTTIVLPILNAGLGLLGLLVGVYATLR